MLKLAGDMHVYGSRDGHVKAVAVRFNPQAPQPALQPQPAGRIPAREAACEGARTAALERRLYHFVHSVSQDLLVVWSCLFLSRGCGHAGAGGENGPASLGLAGRASCESPPLFAAANMCRGRRWAPLIGYRRGHRATGRTTARLHCALRSACRIEGVVGLGCVESALVLAVGWAAGSYKRDANAAASLAGV